MVNHSKSGQALLLILMVMAVVTTIAGTAAYRATTQTQTAKLSEEGKSAFQAAEGLLQQALGGGTPNPAFFGNLNQGVIPVVTVTQSATQFLTPFVPKDGQYSIYLTDYNPSTNVFGTNYTTGPMNIFFESTSGQCPVLEVTRVAADNSVTKTITNDSICGNRVDNGSSGSPLAVSGATQPFTGGVTLTKMATFTISGNSKLLIIRPLFYGTYLGFTSALPAQGVAISASAKTVGGAQKTVKVYQSYPQIPAELFMTVL